MPEATKKGTGRPRKSTIDTAAIVSSLFVPSTSHVVVDESLVDKDIEDRNMGNPPLQDNTSVMAASDKNTLHNISMDDPTDKPSSWASKLKPCAKGMALSYVSPDDNVASIDLDDIDTDLKFWNTTLVGSFLGAKHSLS